MDFVPSVLVVDDFLTMRRIVRNQLEEIGFRDIDDAEDGESALRKLRSKDFHLIISDWNMQPMTGLEFLKEVRSDRRLKKLPFIMVTAESKIENVQAAREAGVTNYIIKPFTAEVLRKKIAASFAAA
ncbi:MAG: two-component system response regulator [Rhizobiales bacterium NRL2]|jgi:two-component system chemotaxis response regulator CheY|uniref:Two-component system response regulator n=2 Tax=Minwuia thermotolerans TaxID=2056226 RepID=A0A2M9G2C8_9PROT|nr:MAG: two-component system response regulator [Rhizobiales bacterium NRL2]PJK29877.1 two-component system response regulator [Minwuia thermotolerans]